jgi:LysB family phage lysis regulatory protein
MSLRLILLAATALAFASLVAALFWYRGEAIAAAAEADKARAALGIAIEANQAQEKTIADLRAENERNDAITLELAQHLAEVNAAQMETSAELARLKEGNSDVRSYLDASVPPALRKLYDRGAKGGGAH